MSEVLSNNPHLPTMLIEACKDAGVDLGKNTENYPLLERDFNEHELEGIELARTALLDHLPLVHSSKRPIEDGDIKPFSSKPEEVTGRTGQLDRDLGLDQAVFMHWGAVEKSGGYGAFHTIIDAREILFDDRCFVTPTDIAVQAFSADNGMDELNKEKYNRVVKDYFQKILGGRDWLELMAREVYLRTRNGGAVDLDYFQQFGEIKFHGAVPHSAIKGNIGPTDEHEVWKEMFKHGFVPGPVSRSQPVRMNLYDVTPQELGLSGEEATNYWRALYTLPTASTMSSFAIQQADV